MMLLNIQGMTPSATSIQRWKLEYLSNLLFTSNLNYLVLAITETWLKPFMSDAQVKISNFNVFRADRKKRGRGGHCFMSMSQYQSMTVTLMMMIYVKQFSVHLLPLVISLPVFISPVMLQKAASLACSSFSSP